MSGDIKGITIEFRGNATPLQKAIRQVDSELKKTTKELSNVNKALKFNPGNVDLWRQKQQLLKDKINETTDKLDALRAAQKQMDAAHVDKNSEAYRKLQREIIETESQLKHFKSEMRAIGNVNLRALSEEFKKIGGKMTDVGKTLTTKVTVPLAAVGAASLKVGADFDTAMSQVAATMGTTVDQIQDLRDFAKEMGSTTAFTATQAAEGLNYMALAGYDAEKSMQMLPTVLNLAAAGSMDLAAASDMVTDAQSALGLSTEETVDLVNQMAKASSTTNTSVAQLGEAMLTVGGTAKMMKGGTQELSQTLGILADNGIKGSEGGTALRNILLSLSAPTSKAAAEMKRLNLDVFDAEGNMRSMEDIIGDLGSALDGMTDEERTQAISNIFNKRDLKSVNALLGTSAERWDEVGDAIANAGDAAAQMADTQLDNMAGSLTLLKSALEGAGIAISDVLAPYVKQLAEWLSGLVQKFNELSPTAQKIIVIVGAIAAAIGPLLVVLGAITSGIGAVMGALALLAGPVGIVIAVIAALVAVGVLLYKNWDTIKAKAIEFKDNVVATFNNFKTQVITTFNNIKTAIVTPIQNAIDKVKAIIDKIKSWFPINIGKIFSNLKLPHFRLTGKFSLKDMTVPHLSVDWYAQGGIFDSPTIAGIGESGPEAVVPLDKFWKKLDEMAAGQNIVININGANADPREIAEEVKRVLIQETNQRRLAWQ